MDDTIYPDGATVEIGVTGHPLMTYRVRDKFYPMLEMNILYLRLVVVDETDQPINFLLVRPDQIDYRLLPYTDEVMEAVDAAATKANEAFIAKQARDNEAPPDDLEGKGYI